MKLFAWFRSRRRHAITAAPTRLRDSSVGWLHGGR
ncbi:MAG: hypothetical protein JWO69_907 [Thermoleophilia bacterium]|jgi:hypothetical protein|nr:hypothetical protein [Thermoleophilia bacterium]